MTDRIPLSETEHEAWEMDALALSTKAWVPYQGPQGGEGWKNTDSDEVVYDDDFEPPEDDALDEEEARQTATDALAREIAENPQGDTAQELARVTGFGDADPSEVASEIAEGVTEDAGAAELYEILDQADEAGQLGDEDQQGDPDWKTGDDPRDWERPPPEDLDDYVSEVQDSEWWEGGKEAFEAAFFGDENTANEHQTDDGDWDPQRVEEVHDEAVRELMNDEARTDEGEEPVGVILMGPPGAGKGWWEENHVDKFDREFTRVNSDDAKEHIPEYNGENAGEVHEESSHIAKKQMFPEAVEEGHNIIFDAVASSSTQQVKEAMEEAGYDMRAVFVDVPSEKSAHNVVSRYEDEGRFTPLDYTVNARDESFSTFADAVLDLDESKVSYYWNDVEWGEPPEGVVEGEELFKMLREAGLISSGHVEKSEDGTARTARSGRGRRGDTRVSQRIRGLARRASSGTDTRVFHKLSESGLERWELDALCVETKAWVPYVGPQGGEGWQDTSTGDIVYDDEPPGERAAEGLDDASEDELLAAVEEVFDEESAQSMEDMSADEIRQTIQGRADPEELEEVGDALEGDSDSADADVPDGPVTAEDLSEGDEVKIDGEDATVTTKKDMGGGYYIAGENDEGETVTARVGASEEFDPADRGGDEPGGTTTAEEVATGDTIVIDGEEGEVTKKSDMGGGYYIAAETEDGEILTARVGPSEEFETSGGEEPEPEDEVYRDEDIDLPNLRYTVEEQGVMVHDGDAYQVDALDIQSGVVHTVDDGAIDVFDDGGGISSEVSALAPQADVEDIGAGASELGYGSGDEVLIEGETDEAVTVAEVDPFGCEAGETELTDTNGNPYCVVGEDLSEPETGPDPTDNEPSDYDVTEGEFDHELAEAVTNGEMLGTDAIYRNMGKVDDEELVAHALMLELQGKDRKTARERLESKLNTLGGDVDQVRAWANGEAPGGGDDGIDLENASKDELLAGLQKVVDRNMMAQDVMDSIADSGMSADQIRENVEDYLSPGKRAALEDVLQEGVDVGGDDGGDDTGYDSPFDDADEDLQDALKNPSDFIGEKGGFSSSGQRSGYNIERMQYLAENASTQALESAFRNEYDATKRAVGGMLHHRSDSDIRADDALDTSFSRSAMDRQEWADNLNEGLDQVDPAITALTLSNINKAGTDNLSGNTLGVWKPSSSSMWTDNEGRYTDVATTKHETMHALHYAVGVKASTRVDNSNERNPDNWTFGVSSNGDTDFSDEFADRVREQIGVWEERAKTHGAHQTECRNYQRTNANEFMAVTYAHWQDDRAKLESKHPEAAALWDDMVGKQDVNTQELELQEGRFGEEFPDELQSGDRVNITLDQTSIGHQGMERTEFTNAEVTGNFGDEMDVALGPEGHTITPDMIESIEARAVGREPNVEREPDLLYDGSDIAEDPNSFESILDGYELNVEYGGGREMEGMRVDEITDQTLWLRDPTLTGMESETNIPLDELERVEAFD